MAALIQQHIELLIVLAIYVAIAAVNALPDPATQKFEFYPWLYHTAKSLLNAVPPQYKSKIPNQ